MAAQSKDAISLLKEDHREVKKLFKEFESAKGDGRKQKLRTKSASSLVSMPRLRRRSSIPRAKASSTKTS